MSTARTCWGIYRELAHSPERVGDDRAILKSVGAAMAARGFNVELVAPEGEFDTDFANVFAMCECSSILDRLRNAEKAGSIIVNSPDAIRNTYRHRMVELLARHHVPTPASQIVASDARIPRPPQGVWVKRYDFHATDAHDVIFTSSAADWQDALHGFAERGIPYIIAQEHVPGDLVKFYGVRDFRTTVDGNWFEWFYHCKKNLLEYPFEVSVLRRVAFAAAAALGLEIFGGDAIIRADGEPVIVDVNAWPSYARIRNRAAQAIADLLTERFQRRPRVMTTRRC
jgi:hypothetical protein